METLKHWVEDRQENGDDGAGYADFSAVVCGDCLYPISKCGGCQS